MGYGTGRPSGGARPRNALRFNPMRGYLAGGVENKGQQAQEKAAGLTRVIDPLEEKKRKLEYLTKLTQPAESKRTGNGINAPSYQKRVLG